MCVCLGAGSGCAAAAAASDDDGCVKGGGEMESLCLLLSAPRTSAATSLTTRTRVYTAPVMDVRVCVCVSEWLAI